MQKFKSKKGFTLAELLIVVAIIAVLTAIAVPLFVGSLSKANKAVEDANKRAVRGAAVAYILDNQSEETLLDTNKKLTGPWEATAELDTSGNIETINVIYKAEITESYTEKDGKITIVLKIADLTITSK